MFADPFVVPSLWTAVTADAAGNISWIATERAADHSAYRWQDTGLNDHVLFIGHQYGRRGRFTVRHSVSGYGPTLAVPAENQLFTQSCYVVCDVPLTGPVQTTSGPIADLFRRQMKTVGSFLVAAGAVTVDPPMARVVAGET